VFETTCKNVRVVRAFIVTGMNAELGFSLTSILEVFLKVFMKMLSLIQVHYFSENILLIIFFPIL
jgi:hypothetical protein